MQTGRKHQCLMSFIFCYDITEIVTQPQCYIADLPWKICNGTEKPLQTFPIAPYHFNRHKFYLLIFILIVAIWWKNTRYLHNWILIVLTLNVIYLDKRYSLYVIFKRIESATWISLDYHLLTYLNPGKIIWSIDFFLNLLITKSAYYPSHHITIITCTIFYYDFLTLEEFLQSRMAFHWNGLTSCYSFPESKMINIMLPMDTDFKSVNSKICILFIQSHYNYYM